MNPKRGETPRPQGLRTGPHPRRPRPCDCSAGGARSEGRGARGDSRLSGGPGARSGPSRFNKSADARSTPRDEARAPRP